MELEKILHKIETAKLINITQNSGRIYLQGSLHEQKLQLLKRLKEVAESYENYQRDC